MTGNKNKDLSKVNFDILKKSIIDEAKLFIDFVKTLRFREKSNYEIC